MVLQSFMERLRHSRIGDTTISRMLLGSGFLILGIIGLFVPFLQGFVFIAIGVLLLTRKDWKNFILQKWDNYKEKKSKKK